MYRNLIGPISILSFLLACTESTEPVSPADAGVATDGGPVDSDGGSNGADAGPAGDASVVRPVAVSEKANIRFKRNERIQNDFAQALGLTSTEVCLELGQYDCTRFVHQITLGGVEPYVQGLTKPNPSTTLTTPIAVERVALSACARRVALDAQDLSSAVIFQNIPVTDDGQLADVNDATVTEAIDRLYKRALLRAPTAREIAHHQQLYRDIAADEQPNPAQDWAILSCFSVLTSMESLFY